MCAKEGIGKYDMWYGVVCKVVMSSCMSTVFSLEGGRGTVPCLVITAIPQFMIYIYIDIPFVTFFIYSIHTINDGLPGRGFY